MEVALDERLSIVEYLIEQGADVNMRDQFGHTALMFASQQYVDIVHHLLKPYNNIKGTEDCITFVQSICKGYCSKVIHMLECGVDVNTHNQSGFTALMYATFKKRLDIVQVLVENGAGVDIRNRFNKTALMYAAYCDCDGDLGIVKSLINHGADINIRDKDGSTALMQAAQNGNVDIVIYLMKSQNHNLSIYLAHPNKNVRKIAKSLVDTMEIEI